MLPKIIDLFSGCGGLSLGFEKAGFKVVAGVEIVPEACKTISYNLDYRYGREQSYICGDISDIDAKIFKNRFGKEGCIVIGGPPCQAYSIAGRAKLRSLGEERINTNDNRGYLYQDFLRFVYDIDAVGVVMENVPESISFGDMNIPEIVCESLEQHGYIVFWTLLNAADFGVPQLRERVFVFAVKRTENITVNLPKPTHGCPDDYQTRNQKKLSLFQQFSHFITPQQTKRVQKKWVTVGDAFSDLPELFPSSESKYRSVKLNEIMEYSTEAQNDFQRMMRKWYDTESFGVSANAFRNNKRDFEIFEKMKQGDDYTEASMIADERFEKEAAVLGYKKGTEEYQKLHAKMVPVYDRNKFDKKWQKLQNDKPAYTLVAHLSKDTYGFIHPTEPRGISVREAARLQSFPDDFFFNCSMGDAFKQIGNAVPPLLALGVAKSMKQAFRNKR